MWNPELLLVSDHPSARGCLLSHEIRAIELGPDADGKMHLGPVLNIPAGSEVECCGQGFNASTIKICWHGKFYFIFRQDLESQSKPAFRYACCGG